MFSKVQFSRDRLIKRRNKEFNENISCCKETLEINIESLKKLDWAYINKK